MFLRCPNCGFSFGLFINEEDDNILTELKTCPCGTLMEETDALYSVIVPASEEVQREHMA